MLKLIALLSAAIPLALFLRATFGARPTKLGAAWREAKKQVDLGITIFLAIIGCICVVAAARQRGVPLDVLDVGSPDTARLYTTKLVLSRPDQHVAWRGDACPKDSLALVDLIRGAGPH